MLKTQVIKSFLTHHTHVDLSGLYNHDMECQVNVGQDGGERVEGDYKGRQWHGWSDGIQTWKSFRIPIGANTEPSFNDSEMKFSLDEHAEGIGMTGWDWKAKLSRWVAFDFDAIVGHSDKHAQKLDSQQLQHVRDEAAKIPWVTIRHSTSGKGLHLYVMLDPVITVNHNEHAALGRAILGTMSAQVGFDFNSKVDVCGGNMWVWHRKMKGTNGLQLIKEGGLLLDPPANWRDHIKVVSGRSKRTVPGFVAEGEVSKFEELTTHSNYVKLDEEHKKLIAWLTENHAMFWWDQDHHFLVAHTHDLQTAHEILGMRGIFKTVALGAKQGDHNCWMTPMRQGSWNVRRYGKGTGEDTTWTQDGHGYTTCYLNRDPDLQIAARANEGVEHPKGGFVFRNLGDAKSAALVLGADIDVPSYMLNHKARLLKHKDGRLVVEIDRQNDDTALPGWVNDPKKFIKIFNTQRDDPIGMDVGSYDDMVRHLVTGDGSDYGWVIKSSDTWHDEPLQHVNHVLTSMGLTKGVDLKTVLGVSVLQPWQIVNKPFEPEYTGDRQWNRNAPQFKFAPSYDKEVLYHPTWDLILRHIGKSLDHILPGNEWAKNNGIKFGSDYLKCWIASLFKEPLQPLPYLFLFGPQDSGKSVLHEALSVLITTGYQRADTALTSNSGFNAELESAILCVVEETDLKKNKQAYNRIKDWVTSRELSIHRKTKTPYHVVNSTHWIQCANESSACPIFSGDTRITVLFVDALVQQAKIAKRELIADLEKEGPDFLADILKLELPTSNDRLNIPVIETQEKLQVSQQNQNSLELFLEEQCFYVPGSMVTIDDFYKRFNDWLEPTERYDWSKIKVGRNLPSKFCKGRNATTSQWCYGNVSFVEGDSNGVPLIVHIDKLVPKVVS